MPHQQPARSTQNTNKQAPSENKVTVGAAARENDFNGLEIDILTALVHLKMAFGSTWNNIFTMRESESEERKKKGQNRES